jgi:hypothetical protein
MKSLLVCLAMLAAASMAWGQDSIKVRAAAASNGQSQKTMRVAMTVADGNGWTVTDLTPQNLNIATMAIPNYSPCGFNSVSSMVYSGGAYQITLSMPPLGNCVTYKGDYVVRLNVSKGTASDAVLVKLTVD